MLSENAIHEVFRRLCERKPEQNVIPEVKIKDTVYKSLVSVVLSAQSRDANTMKATKKLFAVAQTPEEILALPDERLQGLIKDAGLYRAKARSIKRMAAALLEEHGGVVPSTREDLMRLPGVGRKSADIMLRFVFGEAAVAVDTHVFRVSKRLGLAQGKVEAQVARQLEHRIPEEWRWGAHIWLLEHGKEICRSRRPRCEACFLNDVCERNGVVMAGMEPPAALPAGE
jgi:endonuclease III